MPKFASIAMDEIKHDPRSGQFVSGPKSKSKSKSKSSSTENPVTLIRYHQGKGGVAEHKFVHGDAKTLVRDWMDSLGLDPDDEDDQKQVSWLHGHQRV